MTTSIKTCFRSPNTTRHMSGGITTNNLGLFMRKYKSTPLNVEAFILTLEGVSLNATASRIGLSSGRVRYALHSECQIRCPKLYQSLIKHKLTPSLAELRRHSSAFIDGSDIGQFAHAPKSLRPIRQTTITVAAKEPSIFERMFKSVFG
jgi:hypothetical protein